MRASCLDEFGRILYQEVPRLAKGEKSSEPFKLLRLGAGRKFSKEEVIVYGFGVDEVDPIGWTKKRPSLDGAAG